MVLAMTQLVLQFYACTRGHTNASTCYIPTDAASKIVKCVFFIYSSNPSKYLMSPLKNAF